MPPIKMNPQNWAWGPEFHWSEFDDPHAEEQDTGLYMDPSFMDRLHSVRRLIGTQCRVNPNGGFSSKGHITGSAHYSGLAADIRFPGASLVQLGNVIHSIGFNGVGFYEHWKPCAGFHVDMAKRRARWARTKDGEYVSLT